MSKISHCGACGLLKHWSLKTTQLDQSVVMKIFKCCEMHCTAGHVEHKKSVIEEGNGWVSVFCEVFCVCFLIQCFGSTVFTYAPLLIMRILGDKIGTVRPIVLIYQRSMCCTSTNIFKKNALNQVRTAGQDKL